jgi:hypothetical protein
MSLFEEQDEDQDNGWTDQPEPHILLPTQKTAAGNSSLDWHWFCATFSIQFSVKSFPQPV